MTTYPSTSLGHQHHEAVDPVIDAPRLQTQFQKIIAFMRDHAWHTQFEIAAATGAPQGSVGSQLRNARVEGYTIEKHRTKDDGGTWAYRLVTGDPVQENLL